ncbi:MAG: ATP-binding protein [Sphaerochaeta sp.]|nr:ATP-binding protein [Sphaerochaeta sp.]
MNRLVAALFDYASLGVYTTGDIVHAVAGSDAARYSLVKRALADGDLIRIKRGLYMLPHRYRTVEVSAHTISSMIVAQSYMSLESALDSKVLIVSLANKLQIPKCSNVVGWFARCLTVDYGGPTENLERCTSVSSQFVTVETQNHVLRFLSIFDKSIKGFNVEEIPGEREGKRKAFHIDALHQGLESDDLIPIPLQEESAGTIKLFSLYWSLLPALKNGTPLFIDKMNARLHPLLVRNLVLLFTDQTLNPHHAQLIFTSHDTWHLSNKSFKRDEIWFTAKSDSGASVLYSLADFKDEEGNKIRKDEDYEKNYLLGKYGAIPSIEQIKTILPDYQGG